VKDTSSGPAAAGKGACAFYTRGAGTGYRVAPWPSKKVLVIELAALRKILQIDPDNRWLWSRQA